jgi:hypothetical protein
VRPASASRFGGASQPRSWPRDALAEVTQQATTRTFVPRKAVTVEELCADWLASLHNARATTVSGYAYCLAPLREQHGHLAVQKLTRPADYPTASPTGGDRPARFRLRSV